MCLYANPKDIHTRNAGVCLERFSIIILRGVKGNSKLSFEVLREIGTTFCDVMTLQMALSSISLKL